MTTALPPLNVRLDDIPSCWEGVIPAAIATVAEDGTPNVTYLSIVHRVDERHVALSRQFFKKTDENTQRNPLAQVSVVEVTTGRIFALDLRYERTESDGPLFERMRTHLDAVALESGMANVFKLKGIDVCEVIQCSLVPGNPPVSHEALAGPVSLAEVNAVSQRISGAEDLDELLQIFLDACRELARCEHAFVMLADETAEHLYTVASTGYGDVGTGSEIEVGAGLIGLAAARRQSVRVTHMARDLRYAQASRGTTASRGVSEIPLPALVSTQSQLVTPMLSRHELVGVVVLESERIGAFQPEDECLVGILASQVASAMTLLVGGHERGAEETSDADLGVAAGAAVAPAVVKYYRDDESVFLDNEYLIKGVAGGILWRLLRQYVDEGREEFSNRELRLDSSLALPDIKDNLEARLILLRKRLEERCDYLRIEKVARGRFRLNVSRPISLISAEDAVPPSP